MFLGLLRASCAVLLCVLSACNGTAIVTLTATPSTDNFLTYRVGLVSVALQTSDGKTTSEALPASTSVDLANMLDVSEVLGAVSTQKANYKSIVVTVDYGSADIVYDDGSVNGLALTPLGSGGQALGQVALTLTLDPADSVDVTEGKTARVALDFKLAASNVVNTATKTVTVTPVIGASASPIDTKLVRVRGPLKSVVASDSEFSVGITPFDFPTSEGGDLPISPSSVTTYEVNGAASTGSAGLAQLAALSSDSMVVALGSLTSTETTTTSTTDGTTTTSSSTNIAFAATQVLAGSGVQSSTWDRISGVVAARSGNTVTLEDATLIDIDGSNTFLPGTATVNLGAGTVVTVSGQGAPALNTIAQVSVGSSINAFGTASTPISGNVTLDASAGLVRLTPTSASGLVTVLGSATLDLSLTALGGRSLAAFDFVGTGSTSAKQASAAAYVVSTGALDLTNSTVGVPVKVGGVVAAFGAAPPDFTATTLLDPTTIQALMVLDWGGGTAAPFTTFDTSAIDVSVSNASIGTRHLIRVGAESLNLVGMASDPLIVPSTSAATLLFAIAHRNSGTVENFVTYTAFITALQSELTGSVLATGLTAAGEYTASTYTFSATSVTLVLAN